MTSPTGRFEASCLDFGRRHLGFLETEVTVWEIFGLFGVWNNGMVWHLIISAMHVQFTKVLMPNLSL